MMNAKLTIAVIGCGGVGGYYGTQLNRAGHEVHYLVRSDAAHVRKHGWYVQSKLGDYALAGRNVHAYESVEDMPQCDVVLLALKTTSNHLLDELLPKVLKQDGFVFVLQNGIGIEEQVAEVVGNDRVAGGLCFVCSVKRGPGHIEHQDYGWMTAGDYRADGEPAGVTERLRLIQEMFNGTDVPIELKEDLTQARWQKLIFNIPFNGLSVVLNADTYAMTHDLDVRELAWELMLEVGEATKAAVGREIPEAFMAEIMEKTTVMRPYFPSMKLDHDAGRMMEVEGIFGETARRAMAGGYRAEKIWTLYRQLKFLDRTNDD
ncbi:2-dehydropantoate 2-reductase [Poriferisphaera sp. WC338]|uniref:2-dehydropantoate 2-reductase n=1 Tax=Poriferisphaera sp. WC338 TaxID=3425129 RepID=UPI003D8152EC